MFTRILVPLDGSRFSTRALPYAIETARHFEAELVLLRVLKPTLPKTIAVGAVPGTESPATVELAVREARRSDAQQQRAARRYLSRKKREVTRRGVPCSSRVHFGEAADLIQAVARKDKANLVVMTTHAKSRFKKALTGSVADEVIRGLKIPVMVISR
jgi:nucleotide-binding universal stress UspA family protein